MDNNPQNTPQPQDNPPEPVPTIPPEAELPQFQTAEPVPIMPIEPIQSQFEPNGPNPEKPAKKSKKMLIIIIAIVAVVSVVIFLSFNSKKLTPVKVKTLAGELGKEVELKNNSELPKSYTDPSLIVSFDAPDYHQTSDGYSRLFQAQDYFIIFCRGGEEKDMPLSEINDYNFQTFQYSTGTKVSFGIPQKMVVETSMEKTINDIGTLRFEGFINYYQSYNNKETDNYVMGYNFFVKGIPVQLLGVSTDKDKKPATTENIIKDIDAMMQTVKIKE